MRRERLREADELKALDRARTELKKDKCVGNFRQAHDRSTQGVREDYATAADGFLARDGSELILAAVREFVCRASLNAADRMSRPSSRSASRRGHGGPER